MVREYVEIGEADTLDVLIDRLLDVRRALPSDAGPASVSFRGDDNFGRHILVTYLRPQRADERAITERAGEFAAAWRQASRGRCASC